VWSSKAERKPLQAALAKGNGRVGEIRGAFSPETKQAGSTLRLVRLWTKKYKEGVVWQDKLGSFV
jgi:hypothetical protein